MPDLSMYRVGASSYEPPVTYSLTLSFRTERA